MSTFQNQNQFAQTPLLGQVDLIAGPNNVISVMIDPASVATQAQLQAGSPMKIVDVVGTQIIVDAAAITDVAAGVIIYNPRKNLYVAGDTVEIGLAGTVVYLETSAAIARGATVQAATATGLVATRASGNAGIGRMLDKPAAANVLARVQIAPVGIATTFAALTALTSSQNATTAASAPSVGYVQAEAVTTANLANALKASYNQLQTDVDTLRTEVVALRAALLSAGIVL